MPENKGKLRVKARNFQFYGEIKTMHKGQIIDFSNGEHNRLYEFWMKREDRTEDDRDTFDILNEK